MRISRSRPSLGGELAAVRGGQPHRARGGTPGAVSDLERHRRLFPADIRPQSHEIIRTWAFYTIAKAMLHENAVPWRHAVISVQLGFWWIRRFPRACHLKCFTALVR